MSKKSRKNTAVAPLALTPSTVSAGVAVQHTHTTVTTPVVDTDATRRSIRQICLTGIAAGRSTADIAAEVIAAHPTSMAAQKSKVHIAWYRTRAKKAGTPEQKAVAKLLADTTSDANVA